MEVRVTRDLARKLTDLSAATGRAADELVHDALTGYLEELTTLRATLDGRYDDLKSGRVKAIDGDAVRARLRERSEQRRTRA